jgi:hypothetical protein
MLEFRKLVAETAVANQSGAMEADTISKHGRSSKSQMSRFNRCLALLAFVLISNLAFAQENNFSFGLNLEKNKNDESVGLNLTSPYWKDAALRFTWNIHKFDYLPIGEEKIKQSEYHSFRFGYTLRLPEITEVIRPYFDGGAIGVIPHNYFSDKKFQAGVFIAIGFEAFPKNNKRFGYFAETGFVSIFDSKNERGVDSKEYAYLQFAFGLRLYLGK